MAPCSGSYTDIFRKVVDHSDYMRPVYESDAKVSVLSSFVIKRGFWGPYFGPKTAYQHLLFRYSSLLTVPLPEYE